MKRILLDTVIKKGKVPKIQEKTSVSFLCNETILEEKELYTDSSGQIHSSLQIPTDSRVMPQYFFYDKNGLVSSQRRGLDYLYSDNIIYGSDIPLLMVRDLPGFGYDSLTRTLGNRKFLNTETSQSVTPLSGSVSTVDDTDFYSSIHTISLDQIVIPKSIHGLATDTQLAVFCFLYKDSVQIYEDSLEIDSTGTITISFTGLTGNVYVVLSCPVATGQTYPVNLVPALTLTPANTTFTISTGIGTPGDSHKAIVLFEDDGLGGSRRINPDEYYYTINNDEITVNFTTARAAYLLAVGDDQDLFDDGRTSFSSEVDIQVSPYTDTQAFIDQRFGALFYQLIAANTYQEIRIDTVQQISDGGSYYIQVEKPLGVGDINNVRIFRFYLESQVPNPQAEITLSTNNFNVQIGDKVNDKFVIGLFSNGDASSVILDGATSSPFIVSRKRHSLNKGILTVDKRVNVTSLVFPETEPTLKKYIFLADQNLTVNISTSSTEENLDINSNVIESKGIFFNEKDFTKKSSEYSLLKNTVLSPFQFNVLVYTKIDSNIFDIVTSNILEVEDILVQGVNFYFIKSLEKISTGYRVTTHKDIPTTNVGPTKYAQILKTVVFQGPIFDPGVEVYFGNRKSEIICFAPPEQVAISRVETTDGNYQYLTIERSESAEIPLALKPGDLVYQNVLSAYKDMPYLASPVLEIINTFTDGITFVYTVKVRNLDYRITGGGNTAFVHAPNKLYVVPPVQDSGTYNVLVNNQHYGIINLPNSFTY